MSIPTEELLQTFDLVGYGRTVTRTFSNGRSSFKYCILYFFTARKTLKAENFCTVEELTVAFRVFDTHEVPALTPEEVPCILTRMDESINVDAHYDVMAGTVFDDKGRMEVQQLAQHILRSAREHKLTTKQILKELER
ncbi:hypothetical protein LSM04_008750 [Trypanosoma melophagium]|uniref:uncharacterized protein n=1 Tax=Trypanosoma melophagium TaxID=715481 RepID=UPI00351A25B0|nr:hypothetical protein LSM04_008750 [Trypanosoma melophagium]